jgi:uncharacterized protein (TIGR03790 family)
VLRFLEAELAAILPERCPPALLLLLAFLWCPGLLFAQSGENVLVVANGANAEARRIAEYYVEKRAIPAGHLLALDTLDPDPDETISRADYHARIERPIRAWLDRHSAHDRILYIVLVRGIPLRVQGTGGRAGTSASVDSELTLLYRKLTGQALAPQGQTPNPYFLGAAAISGASPFTHERHDIFLVSRLDGFTADEVIRLIDRSTAPSSDGSIMLVQRAGSREQPNEWLRETAGRLKTTRLAERVLLAGEGDPAEPRGPVIGYASWGSGDPQQGSRTPAVDFAPGAIAIRFLSTDARTFREPPNSWRAGSWDDRKSFYEGTPEPLTGDLIRAGVTGTVGYVAEPYLDGLVRPQVVFPAYLAGFSIVESFYLAMPALGWQAIVVGDPLCAPFRTGTSTQDEIHQGIDPETELPVFFARRRLERSVQRGWDRRAVALLLRAGARFARDDQEGGRAALEEATALDDRLTPAHLQLALIYEQAGEDELARQRYRVVLAQSPNDVVALNNLAYSLATRMDRAAEALPLAERAHTLSRGNPSVADTLGWINHLLGRHQEASRLMAAVAKAGPKDPEMRLRAAIVFEAAGNTDGSAEQLRLALEIDPELENRDEVKQLRARLGSAAPIGAGR